MLKLKTSLEQLISGGPNGFLLVCQVVNDIRVIEIKFSSESFYDPLTSTLQWLPNKVKTFYNTATENGIENYVPFIGLAHELAHALSDLRGWADYNYWLSYTTGKKTEYATYDEIFATHWKNKIRAENGYPLRTHYYLEVGNGSLVVDSQRRALYINFKDKRISYTIINPNRRYQYQFQQQTPRTDSL